jgi:predicted metal-dependent phosphotriesterase family hydrolase
VTSTVITVRGEVAASAFGFCLPHEHAFVDLVRIQPTQLLAYDFQLVDPVLVRDEVARFVQAVEQSSFARAGRPALVELTNSAAVGRDPAALRELAEGLDLHVVMSCGWYREPWFDPEHDRLLPDRLAETLIDEISTGVGETGVRPGIIGELGTDRDFVSALEERVLRASARAQRATGLSITLHARASRVALSQLEVLREESVEPARIIVGHVDTIHDPDYHEHLADHGVWVEFDTMREATEYTARRGVRYVMEARRRGYLDRLLLSSDVCALSHLTAYGGSGYGYVPTGLVARLQAEGVSDEELHMLFVDNPWRALTGEVRA